MRCPIFCLVWFWCLFVIPVDNTTLNMLRLDEFHRDEFAGRRIPYFSCWVPFALLEGKDITYMGGAKQLHECTIKAISWSSLGLKPYWRIEFKEAINVLGYQYEKAPKKTVQNYCYKFADIGILGQNDVVFFVLGENPPSTVYNVTEYYKLSSKEQYSLCPAVSLALMVSSLRNELIFGFMYRIYFANIID